MLAKRFLINRLAGPGLGKLPARIKPVLLLIDLGFDSLSIRSRLVEGTRLFMIEFQYFCKLRHFLAMIGFAKSHSIPILVVEYMGPTDPCILQACGVRPIVKKGMDAYPAIKDILQSHGANVAIVGGFEMQDCVLETAESLTQNGFAVLTSTELLLKGNKPMANAYVYSSIFFLGELFYFLNTYYFQKTGDLVALLGKRLAGSDIAHSSPALRHK